MGKVIFIMLLGYLLGTISPAALIAAKKQINLRQIGTGNLGATNTMLTVGKKYGVFVMICDILKAYISVKIAKLMVLKMMIVWFLAGCCVVLGYIFPFYMNFKGGKGVAAFDGMVLALRPIHFFILLFIGIILAIVTNYVFAIPVSAAALYPLLMFRYTRKISVFLLLMGIGALIIKKHQNNFARMKEGTEITVRDYFGRRLIG